MTHALYSTVMAHAPRGFGHPGTPAAPGAPATLGRGRKGRPTRAFPLNWNFPAPAGRAAALRNCKSRVLMIKLRA